MEVPSSEPPSEIEADKLPLLMEQQEILSHAEHIVDILRNDDASSSSSHDDGLDTLDNVDRPSTMNQAPINETSVSSSNIANSRNSSLSRRSEGYSHRRRSPLNSGLWIGVELVVTMGQIIASIIVLSLSRNENPQAPLFTWVVGYASGCVATLPILYWRYLRRSQGSEEGIQLGQGSVHSNSSSEPAPYTAISVSPSSEGGNQQTEISALGTGQIAQSLSSCPNGLMDHFKMALDCFFAVWFVVGNVWIFGGHSSPSDAPKLYRLSIVFLTFSCIGYAMPFILCATICCCFPCIISILGFREDRSVTRGATSEFINALPTYKFSSRKNSSSQNINSDNGEGGLLASATEKERRLSGEDSVCCICLAKYEDNDELRELPCSHLFHVECIDKWLKINASCPLCKLEVGERGGTSPSVANSSHHHSESRLGNRPAEGVYGSTIV